MKKICKDNIKFSLHNGLCSARWTCKNVNSNNCNPTPEEGEDYLKCDYYEARKDL